MIPYDLDPSLHSTEPESTLLDDGFSPPPHSNVQPDEVEAQAPSVPVDPALWAKSSF